MKWWTFGSMKANASLAMMLRGADGVIPRFDDYFVEILDAGGYHAAEKRLRTIARGPAEAAPLPLVLRAASNSGSVYQRT